MKRMEVVQGLGPKPPVVPVGDGSLTDSSQR
jgi:hypothetical protein